MKRSWIAVSALIAFVLTLVAFGSEPKAAETDRITLDRATHFVNVENEVVRLAPGSYRVDFANQRFSSALRRRSSRSTTSGVAASPKSASS